MSNRTDLDYDAPVIPKKTNTWFMQALMVLAVLVVASVGFSFWRMSQAPSPRLDVPETSSAVIQAPASERAP